MTFVYVVLVESEEGAEIEGVYSNEPAAMDCMAVVKASLVAGSYATCCMVRLPVQDALGEIPANA